MKRSRDALEALRALESTQKLAERWDREARRTKALVKTWTRKAKLARKRATRWRRAVRSRAATLERLEAGQ